MAPFSSIIRTKRNPRKRRPQTPPSPASFFPPRSPAWQDEGSRESQYSTNQQASKSTPSVHLTASSVRHDANTTLVQDKDEFTSFSLSDSEKVRPQQSNRGPVNNPGSSMDLTRKSFVDMDENSSIKSSQRMDELLPHPPTRSRSATLPLSSLDHALPPLPSTSTRRRPPAPIRIPRGHAITPSVQLERIPESSLQGSETLHRKAASASTSFLPTIDAGSGGVWKPISRSGNLSPILSPESSTEFGESSASGYVSASLTFKSMPTSLSSGGDGAKSASSSAKGSVTTFNFPLPPPVPQLPQHLEPRQQSNQLLVPSRPPRSTNPNVPVSNDPSAPPSSYNLTNMISSALASSSASTDRFSIQITSETPKFQSTSDDQGPPTLGDLMFSPGFSFPPERASLLYPHMSMRVDSATLPKDFSLFSPPLPSSTSTTVPPESSAASGSRQGHDDTYPISGSTATSTFPGRKRAELSTKSGFESITSSTQVSPDSGVGLSSSSSVTSDLKAARRSVSILNMRPGDVMKAVSVAEIIREDGDSSNTASSTEAEGTIQVVSTPHHGGDGTQRRGSSDSSSSSTRGRRGTRNLGREPSATSVGGTIGKYFLRDSPIDEKGSFQFVPLGVEGQGERSRSKSVSSSTRGSPLGTTFGGTSGPRKSSIPSPAASTPSSASARSPVLPPDSSSVSSARSGTQSQSHHADTSLGVAATPVGLRLRATSETGTTHGARSTNLAHRSRSGSSPGLGSQPGTPQANFPSSASSPSFPQNSPSDHSGGDLSFQLQQYVLPPADVPGNSHPKSAIPHSTSIPPKQIERQSSAGHLNVNYNNQTSGLTLTPSLARSHSFSRPPRPAPSPTGLPVSVTNPSAVPSVATTANSSTSASPTNRTLGLPQGKSTSGGLLVGKLGNIMRNRSFSDAHSGPSSEGGSSGSRTAEGSGMGHSQSPSISPSKKVDLSPSSITATTPPTESKSPSSFSAAVSRVLQTGLSRQRSKRSLREAEKEAPQQPVIEEPHAPAPVTTPAAPKVHVHLQTGRMGVEHREAPSNFPQSPRPFSLTSSGLDHTTQAVTVTVPDFNAEAMAPIAQSHSKTPAEQKQPTPRRPDAVSSRTHNPPATISFYLPNSPNIQKVSSTPKFETIPVRWKGLTLDAAKWTFSSTQLQDIVGKAIRQSAESSSIRLLDPTIIDHEIPDETHHLEVMRDDIKARYKYHVRKRKVLMRSLAFYIDGSDPETAARLMDELTELSEACDQLSEQLFQVTDQLAQISQLKERHFSSALSMALRKLNSSLIRSKGEVIDLQLQLAMVEAERDEAWSTAEAIEKELEGGKSKSPEGSSQDEELLRSPFASVTAWSGSLANRSKSPRSSKVSVSAARKTSIRASKASLRLSSSRRSARSSTSSIRFASVVGGPNSSSGYSSSSRPDSTPNVPPVPAIPGPRLVTESLHPSHLSHVPSRRSSVIATPSSAVRGMRQAQNQLFELLGIPVEDIDITPSRPRSLSEPLSPPLLEVRQNLQRDSKTMSRRVSDPPPVSTLDNINSALAAKLSDDSVFR
ncbi:hypothetical protein FRC03_011252 [Tulasnella sp. 419]|nr:hypothetical protein FRC03_011252 [Tulasnella sp. 419]